MASLEDIDSGMESQETSQSGPKDFSPDKKLEIESDYNDEVNFKHINNSVLINRIPFTAR